MVKVIKYSKQFDDFLDGLSNPRTNIIDKAIIEYAEEPARLPIPKDCEHYDNRKKVAIPEANVVVYYDEFYSHWEFIDDAEFVQRAV